MNTASRTVDAITDIESPPGHSHDNSGLTEPCGAWNGLRLLRSYAVFHLVRWFPAWAGWLPRHEPNITLANPGAAEPAGSPAT